MLKILKLGTFFNRVLRSCRMNAKRVGLFILAAWISKYCIYCCSFHGNLRMFDGTSLEKDTHLIQRREIKLETLMQFSADTVRRYVYNTREF